jgi:abortive infection bacteriophage resistance protein
MNASPKKPYNKPFKTYAEQIELLKSRGMVIEDEAKATFYLQHLNYYRLAAYWLPFEDEKHKHLLKEGTSFQQVLDLYNFDRALRLLILDAVERLEVSFRAIWAYEMARLHGSHAHLKADLWKDPALHRANHDKLLDEVGRSKEVFILHLQNTYSETLPPIWAVCEVMSLGLLSRYYKNLSVQSNVSSIKKTIAQSVLHQLTIIRNICAHHSRLWNRHLLFRPAKVKYAPPTLVQAYQEDDDRIFNLLIILLHFMDRISPEHTWRSEMKSLLLANKAYLKAMGFPSGWEHYALWETP